MNQEVKRVVWEVVRGDIKRCEITGDAYNGYWVNGGYFGNESLHNGYLDKKYITNYDSAIEIAKKYLDTHDVILAEHMKPAEIVAYKYYRPQDNDVIIAFYTELENGLIYMREFGTYDHIVKKTHDSIQHFYADKVFRDNRVYRIENRPNLKNMYACNPFGGKWLYAQAEYRYILELECLV